MATDTDLLDTRGDVQRLAPILGAGVAGMLAVPVGWTGAETVPWDRVETIELEAMFGDRDSFGRVRLHCRGRGRITINTTTGSLEGVVARIAEVCPRAVVDDRVTGEVYGPREGGDDPAVQARMEAIRRCAGRAFSGTALMWLICGVLLIASGLVGVGLTVFAGEKNAFLLGLGLVLGGGLCLKLGVDLRLMS